MANDIQSFASNADNLTKSIGSIQNSIRSLTKDLMNYRKIQDEVFNKKLEVKCDLSGVRKEFANFFKEVNQGFQESQKAGKAQQKVINEMTQSCKNFAKAANEAGNAQKGLGENKFEASGNDIPKDFKGKFKDTLKGGDFLKNVGDSAGNLATTYMESRYGDSKLAGVAVGAISGALAGTAVAPGIGTAIGLVTGAISGLLNSVAKEIKNKDDFVKNEVKATFDATMKARTESLNNGIADANKAEANEFTFDYLLGHKGKDSGKNFMNKMTNYAASNYYKPEDVHNISKNLLVSGYKENEIEPFLAKVGDTAAYLGLKSQDINGLANVLMKAETTKKISNSDLTYLDGLGIHASDAVSKELNLSKDDVEKQISSGAIKGDKIADILNRHMVNNFGGGMAKYAKTSQGMKDEIKEKREIIYGAMGEGASELEKERLRNEISYLNSDEAQNEAKAKAEFGKYMSKLDNMHTFDILAEKYKFYGNKNTVDMINRSEKDPYHELGLQLQLDGENAGLKAEANYRNRPEAQEYEKSKEISIKNIQGNLGTNEAYINQATINAQQLNMGYYGVTNKKDVPTKPSNYLTGNNDKDYGIGYNGISYNSRAIGLGRVPYDNYPALLHEGERVLTRVQADQQQSSSVSPVINMYNTVRDDSDIDKIVTALVTQLSKVQGSFGGAY